MNVLSRALQKYQSEGATATLKRAVPVARDVLSVAIRYIWSNLPRPVYRESVDDLTARFHPKGLRASGYDFTDDIRRESEIINDFIESISSEDIVYDIGANVGIYSCFAAAKCPAGIVAFEPHPETAELLEQNIALNTDYDHTDVYIKQVALGDERSQATLVARGQTGHHLAPEKEGSQTVPVVPGDDIIGSSSTLPPSVLKIDVEGAEVDVLRGLEDTLSEVRLVYCEVHEGFSDRSDTCPREIEGILRDYGFKLTKLSVHEDRYFIKAEVS